jgi:hypothetical protein
MTLRVAGVLVASLFLVAGCGPTTEVKKGTTVKGKVVSNGQPLESYAEYVPGKPQVRLTLDLLDSTGKSAGSTNVQPNGDFKIEGVAPGKYKLTAEHFDQNLQASPASEANIRPGETAGRSKGGSGPRTQDRLQGKFNVENSQITVTVPEGKPEHDVGEIDLEKKDTWSK